MMLCQVVDYRDAITVALNRLTQELGAAQEIFAVRSGSLPRYRRVRHSQRQSAVQYISPRCSDFGKYGK